MTFEHYWPLLLLVTVPYLWRVRNQSLTDLNPSHLKLGTAVRSGVVVLLVFALMQPVWTRSGNWLSVVYVVDISQSVSPQSIADAIDWIEETDTAGGADHTMFVPFAANSFALEDLDQLRSVPVSDRPSEGTIDQSETNLQQALDVASHSFAPNHLKRLVLLTDGHSNRGDATDAAIRLNGEGVRVFTRALAARPGPDVWVDEILMPAKASEEELFPLEVHVYSQAETSGTVEIRNEGEILDSRQVDLLPGINRIGFETRVNQTGPLTIEAEMRVSSDRFPDNNIFRASVDVEGPPRILYIESRQASAHYLSDVLSQQGIEVEVVGPEQIPEGVDEFDAYEAVILSDVPARSITEAQMEALTVYVRDLGGGFILAGGDSVYGEGGYSESRIEEILPIRFELEQEPPSVALIIVLDKSGSMGGQKLELVKEASKAAVDVLEDDHQIGLVAFDYNHYWPVRLQPASNRDAINASISTIIAGGETNIFPALEEAYRELMGVEAEVRHVILLTDGRSLPDDFVTLVASMAEAEQTVSTVAVGNGADRELLSSIAEWGNGREYFIEDATRVPQIFTEETELATQGTLREDPFSPILLKDVEALKGIDFSSGPPLLGYVATLSKETSEVLLESDDEKPILARWQYGLGKTVAFTSDVKDRWASEWLTWDGYGKFWPQLVRETMRREESGGLDLSVEKEGDEVEIEVTAIDEDGNYRNELTLEVRVVDPQENVAILDVRQSGPGTYRAQFRLEERGPYVIRVSEGETGVSRVIPYSYPDEYHFYPADTDFLREISNVTGGTFDPSPDELFAIGDDTVVAPMNLWPYLAFLALLAYLTDLLLRRIRLFES